MRSAFAAAFVLALTCLPATAQIQPSPIIQHYNDYRAALDRGDAVAAEAAAEQALAASEARDGDGGRTAVLALNLATTRLMTDDAIGALAAAQRAHALSQAGAAGADPLFAAIILGRAELAAGEAGGAERLETAFADARLEAMPPTDVHAAAAALGLWAFGEREYERAIAAWEIAGGYAAGSPLGEAYGLGIAKTWQAASIMLDEIGANGSRRMDAHSARDAYIRLVDAMAALWPLAQVETPNLDFTIAQQSYAQTRAWFSVLRAKMMSDNQALPDYGGAQGDADGYAEVGPVDLTRPRCLVRVNARPLPDYPSRALMNGGLAGVTMRLRLNDAGEIVDARAVAVVGGEAFGEAVERVAPRWRVTRRDDSIPNCRMESTLLVSLSFAMGGP